jgi:hypothetical protein
MERDGSFNEVLCEDGFVNAEARFGVPPLTRRLSIIDAISVFGLSVYHRSREASFRSTDWDCRSGRVGATVAAGDMTVSGSLRGV